VDSVRKQTVFVVDDDPDVRNSLSWLIESVDHQAQCFASGQEFLDAYDPEQPGCLILDVRMPGLSGLELQAALVERGALLPVIVVTGHGEVGMAVQALKAGAFDFIEKPFSDEQLLHRIHEALNTDRTLRSRQDQQRGVELLVGKLTPRERQVMELVISGRSNKTIATDLGVSCKTVEAHRANMMRKMRVGNVTELVRVNLLTRSDDAQGIVS
jgi:two-component system response regulator FixJ